MSVEQDPWVAELVRCPACGEELVSHRLRAVEQSREARMCFKCVRVGVVVYFDVLGECDYDGHLVAS